MFAGYLKRTEPTPRTVPVGGPTAAGLALTKWREDQGGEDGVGLVGLRAVDEARYQSGSCGAFQ